MSDLETGTKVHLRNSKSGKNVALMPNGKIHAHGGNGKHATFEVFHHPFNGRFKFFNENGSVRLDSKSCLFVCLFVLHSSGACLKCLAVRFFLGGEGVAF
jgi:hypothetical protein